MKPDTERLAEPKIRVFKVKRPDLGNAWCAFRNWATIEDAEFEGAEPGDQIVIELAEMTQDELDKLPEFEGW